MSGIGAAQPLSRSAAQPLEVEVRDRSSELVGDPCEAVEEDGPMVAGGCADARRFPGRAVHWAEVQASTV